MLQKSKCILISRQKIILYDCVDFTSLINDLRPNIGHHDTDYAVMPRYYAWDYRVLRTFARHYSTGEVIPEKLVESMQDARKMFAATELQRQVTA